MTLNPISERLEHVRKTRELTLKDFHQGLGGEDVCSYSAARNYHFDREPPIPYLLAVADTFGVRFEWLAARRGEMTDAEEAERRAVEGLDLDLREAMEEIPFLQGGFKAAVFFLAGLRLSDHLTMDDLARVILQPMADMDVMYRPGGQEFTDYLHAMLHALMLLTEVDRAARREDFMEVRSPTDDLALLDSTKESTDG